MAKAKISSKDFLDLLDEQNDQPAPAAGLFGRTLPSLPAPLPNSSSEPLNRKQVANVEQTGSKQVAKQVANVEQTGSKQAAATEYSLINASTEKPKRVAQRVARLLANGQQRGSKEVAKPLFETLVGKERSLLLFIVEDCQINGDLKTAPLTLERVGKILDCSSNRAKNVLYRLVEKSLIHRAEAKTGRGGWTRFGVSKELFQKVLLSGTDSKGLANGYQTGSKEIAKQVAQRVAGGSSSSSSNEIENLKTTTTTEPELFDDAKVQLSPEWAAIDVSPLAEINFGQSHLIQLARQAKLSAAEVQESIQFFAFDLRRNGKGRQISGQPINFFMGIVRKGIPYAPPENFESPADEARRKTREFKERKESERKADEQRFVELEFSEWRRGLSPDEVARLLPDWAQKPGQIQDTALKTHFESEVWPQLEAARAGVSESERMEIKAAIEQSLGEAGA